MNQQAEEYLNTALQREPYIAVHLRMGSDWVSGQYELFMWLNPG